MSPSEAFPTQKSDEISNHQRLLLANMDEGFAACEMLYDRKGAPSDYRFLEVNAAFEQQTGLLSADILGKTALELFPDVERTWIEKFGKVATTGTSERFEEFNHNTGRYYETFAYSPEKSSVFLLIRDVTSRNLAQQSVAQSETRLRLALGVGRMATWASNYVANEYIWDEGMVRLLGYQPGVKASHEAWARRVHPEDLPHVIAKNNAAIRLGGEFHAEYRVFSQKDELRWVEARGQIVADEKGKIVSSYGVLVDITERKRDEQHLQESADLLRLALSASQSGYFDRDLSRGITRWSAEMAHLYGFDDGAFNLSVEQWRSSVVPEDLAATEAHVAEAMRTGELKCEYRIVRRNDKQVRWISARGKVLYDQQQNPLRLIGINTDVTDSRRSEEELRVTNQRFELALRNSPIVVFSQDLDLRYTWIYNPALGYQPEGVLGKRDIDLFERGKDSAIIETLKRNVIRSGVGRRQDVIVRDRGVDRCYDLSIEPQRDSSGSIIGVMCAAIDRTERKQAEIALSTQRQLTETVVSQIPSCVAFVRGSDLTLQLINPAYQALAPGKKMVGRRIDEVWSEIPYIAELCRTVLATGQPYSGIDEPVIIRGVANESAEVRYFSWTIHPVNLPGEDQPGLLLSGWETTTRKRAEDALLRTEKLASVGRMAASIAHEINNPLAGTTNLLFLAGEVAGLPEPAREYLEMAQAELNRVAHFARQSLGFYREASGPVRIQLGPLLDSTIELFKAKIGNRCAVVVKSWDSEFEVTGVPGELRQIFSNILANSLDAIDQHGTVRIKISAASSASGEACVRVTIADNGRGIPPGSHAQVFEPFFTTKGSIGTGLGLWVSKQLADKHKGRIRMRSAVSEPRRGTTFCITLPTD